MEREMTFDIFCCKLNGIYQLIPGKSFTGNRRLKGLGFHDGVHFNRENLYILPYQEYQPWKKQYRDCPTVLFSCPAGTLPPEENAVAIPDETAGITALLRDSEKIFASFYEWRELLHEFDLSSQSPNQLMLRAAAFMEMELFVTDKAYHNCFSTRFQKSPENDPLGIRLLSDLEMRNQLNTEPEFAESFNTRGVHLYPNSLFSGLLYYSNIFYQDVYIGRFLAVFREQTFNQGRVRMIEYLSEFVERAYIRYHQNMDSIRKNTQFTETLTALLLAEPADAGAAAGDLAFLGWNPSHTFQVIKLELEEYQGNLVSRDYFCAQFNLAFPSCRTLQLRGEIVSVRNLSLEPDSFDFDRDFPCFLRENLCRAGISNEARGFACFHLLFMEARDALSFGRKKHDTFWYWHFRDYTLDYLRANATCQYPADQLEHRALAILRDYDKKHNGVLLETLSVFVRQRFSASAAANALFIHRSTFLHRLNRIQELTKLDFSDEEQRIWLTISFFIS